MGRVDFRGSLRQDEFVRYGRRTWWGREADAKAGIERLCISLSYVETFNSKIIKGFVPELRSRNVFFVFRDSYVLYIYIYVMNILCTFHAAISWLCYKKTTTLNHLSDSITDISITGICMHHSTTGIRVAICHNFDYVEILNLYKDITQPFQNTDFLNDETQQDTKTIGQSVNSHPRRLHQHKYEFAKKNFSHLL